MNSLEPATLVRSATITDIESLMAESETKSACCHRWLIDTARGPISRGVCKNCGEEKNFSNRPLDIHGKDITQ